MSRLKAKAIEKYHSKYSTYIIYEYKGHKYEVEYANDMSYCVTPAHIQHQDAQEKIDKKIEQEKAQKKYKYENTADYGLDMFFNEI